MIGVTFIQLNTCTNHKKNNPTVTLISCCFLLFPFLKLFVLSSTFLARKERKLSIGVVGPGELFSEVDLSLNNDFLGLECDADDSWPETTI